MIRHHKERRLLRSLLEVRYAPRSEVGHWYVGIVGATEQPWPPIRVGERHCWSSRREATHRLEIYADQLWQDAWDTARYASPDTRAALAERRNGVAADVNRGGVILRPRPAHIDDPEWFVGLRDLSPATRAAIMETLMEQVDKL